jgi:hypothetical protein
MTNNKAREINSPIIKQLLDETTPEELAKIDTAMTNNKQQSAVDSIIEFCQKQMDNDSSIHKGVYLSIIKFCQEQITEESEIHWKTTLLMMTSTDTANVDLNKPLTKPTGL